MVRHPHFRFLTLAGAAVVCTFLATGAHAQDSDDLQRGVARISVMNGDVTVRRGDSGEWVAGVINAPLMSEDSIATGPNSRAEIQFDAANTLRIGGSAEVRLTQLEADRFQMQLARGTATFRVLRPSSAYVEVDTPSISIKPSKQGAYRIFVNDSGETRLIVRAGEVEVYSPRGSQWVTAGQMMMARGSATDPEFQIVNAPPYDEWDQWCDSRDRLMLNSVSAQYVGQGVYGAEDLDNSGSWVDVAPYGRVWRPVVADDWAPYSLGRWSWLDWYGWTWISYDPWGWAPYHYGRWFSDPRWGWCWYPGAFGYRHYWSPALVGWFGFGHGGGFGFGFGHVGWVPLAPYESFHPWWGRGYYGRGFGHSINITNVNVTNIYRNARVRNGISGISADNFRSGRFGGGSIGHFSGDQVRQAGAIRGQVPFEPNNGHLRFSDRNVANVPRTSNNTQFFTHQQPRPVERISFAQQRGGGSGLNRANAANTGNPGFGGRGGQAGSETFNRGGMNRGGQTLQNGRTPAEAAGGFRGGQNAPQSMSRTAQAQSNPQSSGANSARGWRRFGEPAGGGAAPQQNLAPRNNEGGNGNRGFTPNNRALESTRPPSSGGSGNGWQRFGEPGNSGRQQSVSPRSSSPQQYGGRQEYGNPGYGTPRNYESPRSTPRASQPGYSAPRSYGGGGNSAPQYSAPRSEPRYNAPQYNAPRSEPRYNAPQYNAPRSQPRYSAPQYNAPRSEPRYSAPRGGGGGGGYSAPRSSGGGGGGFSAPRSYGGGGGGYSAPRSSGGGGGGFSAPRSSGGGGGGHSSSPRSSGGGGGGGGSRGHR